MSEWQMVEVSRYFPGLLGRVTELHAQYYHRHWGFDYFFEAKVATEMARFLERFDPARDGLWVAVADDRIIGAVAINGQDADTVGARLRWLIVAPEHRGRGIGKVLMREAVAFCRHARFRRVWLTTFAGLDAARCLYEREGFRLLEEREDAHWGKTVPEQTFELLI
jgi:GNAT superfamily N-acetyltransferase